MHGRCRRKWMKPEDVLPILAKIFLRYPGWSTTDKRKREIVAVWGDEFLFWFGREDPADVTRWAMEGCRAIAGAFPPALDELIREVVAAREAERKALQAARLQLQAPEQEIGEEERQGNLRRLRELMAGIGERGVH